MTDKTQVCGRYHDEQPSRLIFTFAFPKAELWCPKCGNTYGLFDADKVFEHEAPPLDPELEKSAARYLFAVACRNAAGVQGKVRLGGKWVYAARLSPAIKRENSEILKGWVYQCATQS